MKREIAKSCLLLAAFLLVGMLVASPAGASAEWTIETVDAPRRFTHFYQRAIAIDGANRPHVAYGDDHLYYAHFDGTRWQYAVVDNSPGVGRYASIALNAAGKVHISYYNWINRDLKYATNATGVWVTETIDSAGGKYTSLAIDIAGKVHISYYDWISNDLKYATNASGAWVTEAIDSFGSVGWYTSLALDARGKVHISYRDLSNGGLKYATTFVGVEIPVLSVTPEPSLGFGEVIAGGSRHLGFTITNTGTGTLTGSATLPAGPFSIVSGNPYNIPAGQSVTVTVRFNPTATGPFSETVTFTSNGGNLNRDAPVWELLKET